MDRLSPGTRLPAEVEGFPARGRSAEPEHLVLRRRLRLTRTLVALENKTILDVGCGSGAQTLLWPPSSRVLAVDIAREDLDQLSARARTRRLTHILPLLSESAELPLPAAAIDLAVGFEVLEHVRNEPGTLSELRRVLKPGGDLVLSVPNKWWIFETHGARLPLLPWNRVPFLSWLPGSIRRHFARARLYRRAEIARGLRRAGFQIEALRYVTAPLDVLGESRLKRGLRATLFRGDATSLPVLATSILAHARRPVTG